jgi:hypothetical protein
VSDEFVLHVPREYDYRLLGTRKAECIDAIQRGRVALLGTPITVHGSSQILLKSLCLTKPMMKDKRKVCVCACGWGEGGATPCGTGPGRVCACLHRRTRVRLPPPPGAGVRGQRVLYLVVRPVPRCPASCLAAVPRWRIPPVRRVAPAVDRQTAPARCPAP